MVGLICNFMPFMIIPIHTSLNKMDKSLIEAAYDLGANRFQTFWKVIWKLSLPGVVNGIMMVFLLAISSFVIPKLLGGGQYMLIGNLIESQFISVGDWNFGSAISMILAVIILISMSLMKRMDKEKESRRIACRKKCFFQRFYVAICLVFFYLPILVTMIFSFNSSKSLTRFTGFSMRWYTELLHNTEVSKAVYVSVTIAILATVISTVLGTITAIGLSKSRKVLKETLLNINNLPILNPDIVTAIGLMLLLIFHHWAGKMLPCCWRTFLFVRHM